MNRAAFKMRLKHVDLVDEYKRRHDEIWPELTALLKNTGVSDYSIFFDEESLTLFAVQKLSSTGGSQDLGNDPIVKKWWDYMADLMETHPDNSPVSTPLPEIFHME